MKATELVLEDGRVAGRARRRTRTASASCAPRWSSAPTAAARSVARLVGAELPTARTRTGARASSPTGGRCVPSWRDVAAQWREGAELGTAFPCDGGLVLVLLMPPVDARRDVPRRPRRRPTSARSRAIPGLRERLRGLRAGRRSASRTDLPSYFRRSSGPGLGTRRRRRALQGPGDRAGDPRRAALRARARRDRRAGARRPAALDAPCARWERERERECLEAYQWTNLLARGEAMTPLEAELYREHRRPTRSWRRELLDVFSRSRRPAEVFTMRRGLRLAAGPSAAAGPTARR